MEELFPSALKALVAAVENISAQREKIKKFIPLSPNIDWDEYGDSLAA